MSRRRWARAAMVVAVAGGLTALLASCAAPGTGTREPAGAAGKPARQAAEISPLANAKFTPPSYNPAWYKACAKSYPAGANSAASAYVTGWADAGKLQISLPTGYPDVAFASASGGSAGGSFGTLPNALLIGSELVQCDLTTVQLDYDGLRELPPMRVSGLAFGFEPVTATAILRQVGPQPVSTMLVEDDGLYQPNGPNIFGIGNGPYTMVTVARLDLQLTDVKVNGVSLNVGKSCHTGILTSPNNSVAPGELVETGNAAAPLPAWTSSLSGGTTAAYATIPPFTGCVTPTGENLDALLTATVSGPGNYVQTSVGPPCLGEGGCAAGENQPKFPPLLISVTHGGRYSSAGSFSMTDSGGPGITISCDNSLISGSFPDAEGPPRGPLATVQFSGFSGCTGGDGSQWQISQAGTADFSALKYVPARASWNNGAQVSDITLDLAGTGTGAAGTCSAVLSGYADASYANDPAVISVNSGASLYVTQSTCPDLPVTGPDDDYGALEPVATYSLTPSDITVLPMVLPTP